MANQNFNPDNYAVSAAGGAAAVTLASPGAAGTPDNRLITQIHWGYSDTPQAGATLTITDNAVVVFRIPVTAGGPGFTPFPNGKMAALVTSALVVTLSAGGGSILAHLTVA